MTAPSTSVEHIKVSEAIDDRLTRVWVVLRRIKEENFNLTVLALIHYILSEVPAAAFIDLSVTDQGGDTMTFDGIGVLRQDYDAWTDDRSYVSVGDPTMPPAVMSDLMEIEWQSTDPAAPLVKGEFVVMDTTYDVFNTEGGGLKQDKVWQYAADLEDYELAEWGRFYESLGARHSGLGRLWIAPALEALSDTYEGFIGEALDPFPDPNDNVAVAAWLARETAPPADEEDTNRPGERLCGCGEYHDVHPD